MSDGLFRLLVSMTRKYSRDPSTRALSSAHILRAAVALHAANTSAAEAALTAAEAVSIPATQERLERRKA